MKTLIVMMCLFLVSGCAALKEKMDAARNSQYGSYVAPDISTADADDLSKDIAQYLMSQFPAAKTTLELEPLKNPLHAKLVDQLAVRGFGIVESKPQSEPQGVQVLYLVTRFDRGLVVRMLYQNKVASRFYDRAIDGRLSLQNRFTVREAAK
jgi:hypothetical protein